MSSILTLQKRKEAFKLLGDYLLSNNEQLGHLVQTAHYYNGWFTPAETDRALKGIGKMLNAGDLGRWLPEEAPQANKSPLKVGLILAGNIPVVGFHDILCVLASGNIALIKLSSQDNKLMPHILNKLTELEPGFTGLIRYTERLEGFDAIIATGSNNTSRYFEYYFGKVPHIIRKNRNSAAVITGTESPQQLHALGNDLFSYYGLGCRNVSKLYVPAGYVFNDFFAAIESYKNIADNHKYNNNYDYNKSIFLINGEHHLDNGFLLVKQDSRLASALAVVHYEEYESITKLENELAGQSEDIQCIVCSDSLKLNITNQQVDFGESQSPALWDYADGTDTMEFLTSLQTKPAN